MELQNVMLEGDMELYLFENGHDDLNSLSLSDLQKQVVTYADELGYEHYTMEGNGTFHGSIVFIRKVFMEQ